MKTLPLLAICAVVALSASEAQGGDDGAWIEYSQQLNGDVYFYDASRVKRMDALRRVWSRIRYKTSVMGASSYQSLMEIDCSEPAERILQSTFFSDPHWKEPAMMTDTTEKPKQSIVAGSATDRLADILCD